VSAPIGGLARGGYRLVFRGTPNAYAANVDLLQGTLNLVFSVGLIVASDGTLQEVIWESPAFEAGLTAGSKLLGVNGRAYEADGLKRAVVDASRTGQLELTVQSRRHVRTVVVRYSGGLRYPHLEPIEGARRRIDDIYARRVA
jgi:predicted metalloprotease with PDZ domain